MLMSWSLVLPAVAATDTVHHTLQVVVQPGQSSIEVIDDVRLPAGSKQAAFTLNSSMTVVAEGAELEHAGVSENGRLSLYKLNGLVSYGKVQLRYHGTIRPGPVSGPFDMPDTVLDEDAIFLDGNSGWVPRFTTAAMQTFEMSVEAPAGWEIISQGRRSGDRGHFHFDMPHAQDDIYLLGGRYARYARQHGDSELAVYLLTPDESLAQRYLDTTADYIDMYSEWIGDYPYAKFAIVENSWQTGYGMPSFTLLGSRVIRLPFILHTSLPHEILHNWWGNGVFIDHSNGNWSEGLTAYMADHFTSSQRGKDAQYRRKALERYANFAAQGRDFALADFRSRHGDASQAVGYGKSLMLFHMLKTAAGEDAFNQGLQAFWLEHRYRTATFTDLLRHLLPDDDDARANFAQQWLYRTGAPQLLPGDVIVSGTNGAYRLSVEVRQQHDGAPYALKLPLQVNFADGTSITETIALDERVDVQVFDYGKPPSGIRLDPNFDVFRLLDPAERPASLARLFGAGRQLLVYPANAGKDDITAWQRLAHAWEQRYGNVVLQSDSDTRELPNDTAVWLLGWDNELLEGMRERFSGERQQLGENTFRIDDLDYRREDHAAVLLDPDNTRTPLGFIGASGDGIGALAGKLTHYGSYGALVFDAGTFANQLKQQLPSLHTPLEKSAASK